MRNLILLSLILLLGVSAFSQEVLFEQDIHLKSFLADKRESFPMVNDETGEVALFLLDNTNILLQLFDEKLTIVNTLSTRRPEGPFKTLLGGYYYDGKYNLLFSNNKKKKFFVTSMNVNEGKSWGISIPIRLKNEYYLTSFGYKNKFYLLTITYNSSLLNLYVFSDGRIPTPEVFDFSEYKFLNSEIPSNTLLSYALSEMWSNPMISKIDNNDLNPLDITSNEHKLYYYDDKLFITLDNEDHVNDKTIVITIDLLDFTSEVRTYKYGVVYCGNAVNIKSNSYLYNDYLYQIKGCKYELCFTMKKLSLDSLVKEYRVNLDEEISFRNTPMLQEGSLYLGTGERALSSTKQILRKMAGSNMGLSVYKAPEYLEVTIGGFKEVKNYGGGGGMTIASPGTTVSTMNGPLTIPATYYYNPTMYSYSNYTTTRSVYFISLFDPLTLEHVDGEVQKLAYDRIRDFSRNINVSVSSETIFRFHDYYVFGYYDKYEKKYYLRKFSD